MPAITAKDIAEKIRRPGEPLTAAIDRFRFWGKQGLIRPVGEAHPGTGRARLYSDAAMLDAVLLEWLTETIGMPAVDAQPMLHEARKRLKDVASDPEDRWLVIHKSHGREDWSLDCVPGSKLEKCCKYSGHSTHVIIKASELIGMLKS